MKVKYYLSFLLGVSSLAIADEDASNLQERDPFGGNTDTVFIEKSFEEENSVFDNDNVKVFASDIPETKANFSTVSERKTEAKASIEVVGTRTQDAMLAIDWRDVKVNPKILSDALCRDCLELTEYLYFGTKRYDETHRVFPGAFQKKTKLPRPPLYETLKNKKIKIFAPFYGTNGGAEGAYVGMLAYRKVANHLELFVVYEGSQGEEFEFLGGIGGASWRTNFQANKVSVDSQKLGLDKEYGKLSFHEGYYSKIYNSKMYLEEKLNDLFSKLDIKEISEFKPKKAGNVTQQDIDNWRGYSVDVYIFGHSQGGGLTQIGAPYITTLIGQRLYGDAFDNKTFNIAHAICMSPARAIGDEHTMDVVLNIMGKGNIFGWCSPLDAVPCLPLGYNGTKRPVLRRAANVLLKILDLFSKLLPKDHADLSKLLSVVSGTKDCYETLPTFAYVDYGDLLEKYCDIGIKVHSDYLKTLPEGKEIDIDPKDLLKDMKEKLPEIKKMAARSRTEKQIKSLKNIRKDIPKIKKIVKEMQKHYFEAHNSGFFGSRYHAIQAARYLKKLIDKVPCTDLIGSQHWGKYVLLQNSDSDKGIWVENLFDANSIGSDIQKDFNRAKEYNDYKGHIVNDWE